MPDVFVAVCRRFRRLGRGWEEERGRRWEVREDVGERVMTFRTWMWENQVVRHYGWSV